MAIARVDGQITATGVDTATGALASVSLGNGSGFDGGAELNVATSFTTSQQLAFSGNCDVPDESSPCEAELYVNFGRTDGGAAGGTLGVEWSIAFEATAEKSDEPNRGPLELPWEIEVVPQ